MATCSGVRKQDIKLQYKQMKPLRIAITGPECSGKSALVQQLSEHFSEPFAAEYARDYLKKRDGVYTESDLLHICKGQIELEEQAMRKADRMVFMDTDIMVIKIWSLFRFGTVHPAIETANVSRRYDLRLLCYPDLPWEADPLRESPDKEERDLLFRLFRRQFEAMGEAFTVIRGTGEKRLACAIEQLEKHFTTA